MSPTPPNDGQFLGPTASIDEAVNWAKGVSVAHVDYDGDLRIARIVTAGLKDIQQSNLRLPDVIQVNAEAFRSEFGEEGTDAPAGTIARILLLNPDSSYRDSPAEDAFRGRLWSTNHPLHPIYHEAGHFSHYRQEHDPVARWRRRTFTGKDARIANHVSWYGGINFAECIAEITAQLLAGRSVPPDILKWYRRQGKLSRDKVAAVRVVPTFQYGKYVGTDLYGFS